MTSQFDRYDPFWIFKARLPAPGQVDLPTSKSFDLSHILENAGASLVGGFVGQQIESLIDTRMSRRIVNDCLKYLERKHSSVGEDSLSQVAFDLIAVSYSYYSKQISFKRNLFPVGYLAKGTWNWLSKRKEDQSLWDSIVDGLMIEPYKVLPAKVNRRTIALLTNAYVVLDLVEEDLYQALLKHYVKSTNDELRNVRPYNGQHSVAKRVADLVHWAEETGTGKYLEQKYPTYESMRIVNL